MMIIGLSGLAGCGKDTVADHLVSNHQFVKVALADPLKRICRDVFDFTDDQLWGSSEKRNKPDPRYPTDRVKTSEGEISYKGIRALRDNPRDVENRIYLTPRYALQQLGTEWGRNCYDDVWIDHALRTAAKIGEGNSLYDARSGLRFFPTTPMTKVHTDIVIPDCRFKNEFAAIRKAGGKLVRIVRGEGLEGVAGSHRSETEQQDVPDSDFDGVLKNDDTLEALFAQVSLLIAFWCPSEMQLKESDLLKQRAKDVEAGKIIPYDKEQVDVPPFMRKR